MEPLEYYLTKRRKGPAVSWQAGLLSMGIHIAVLVICCGPGVEMARESRADETPKQRMVRLFIPAQRSGGPREVRSATPAVPRRVPVSAPPVDGSQTKSVNLRAITLRIQDDVSEQLPEVVRSNHGLFALVEKSDPAYAAYVVEPPEWKLIASQADITGRIRFVLSPADRWSVFRRLRAENGIGWEHFDLCALFAPSYGRCLQDAITRKMAGGARRIVRAATVVFAASRPCGVDVVDLEYGVN